MSSGRLVVCPTPIGNLEDVTLRVLAALREADVVACEDTRHTQVLLERYGVSAKLVSYHEHNERARAAELVERMRGGEVVALVSDAGMPLVTDPGYALVQGCVAAGLSVEVLPGPSSRHHRARGERAADATSGASPASCRASAAPLETSSGRPRRSSPSSPRNRIGASLAILAELDPSRPVAVCRELTKLHEEIVRGTAAELAARYAEQPRAGRDRLVIGGAPARTGADPAAIDAVRTLVESGARAKTGGEGRRRAHRRARPTTLYRAVAT